MQNSQRYHVQWMKHYHIEENDSSLQTNRYLLFDNRLDLMNWLSHDYEIYEWTDPSSYQMLLIGIELVVMCVEEYEQVDVELL